MTQDPSHLPQNKAGEYLFNLFNISGRVAVVTGSGRGLGRAMAVALANAGAAVAIIDVNETDALETRDTIHTQGGTAMCVMMDITDSAQVQDGLEKVRSELGGLDILVNNAGVTTRAGFEDLEEEDWDRVLNVNLGGIYRCTRHAAKSMITHKTHGSIINIASISGLVGNRGGLNSHYCATKGGVIALTRSLAVEWAPYHLRVNAIAPGYFVTPMTDRLKNMNRAFYDELVGRVPFGRFGEGSDLPGAVIYLASDASNFVTGHTLVIDGGYTAW